MASRFDFVDAMANDLIGRGVAAVNETIAFAYDRAKHYVPVRRIFKGTRRGPAMRSVIVGEKVSYAQAMKVYRRNPIDTAKRYEAFKRSQPATHRIIVPRAASSLGVAEAPERSRGPGFSVTGHANSERPVIRYKRVTSTGDFRRLDVQGGRLASVPYAYAKSRDKDWWNYPSKIATGTMGNPAEQRLTSRGRYEVRTGRANFKKADTGETQVGGRLKSTIRPIFASLGSGTGRGEFWGYVEAGGGQYPSEGGRPGRSVTFVALAMEYGNRHNRPHPFMRPALYESRAKFRAEMDKRFPQHG